MIRSFRAKNLRAIADTGEIQFKRLNVVVGRNSSGKSTLLRILPLLRQSVEQKTKGPILWFGRLVDFGSFETAARDNDVERGIELSFEIVYRPRRIATYQKGDSSARRRAPLLFTPNASTVIKVKLHLGGQDGGASSYVRLFEIRCGADVATIEFLSNGAVGDVTVCGKLVEIDHHQLEWFVSQGALVPRISLVAELVFTDDDGETDSYWEEVDYPFKANVVAALTELVHGRTSATRVSEISERLTYADEKRFFNYLNTIAGLPPQSRERVKALGAASTQVTKLRQAVFRSRLPEIIAIIDEQLDLFARSISYVEPLRAVAERYYRRQDLAIDEVDSRGGNTAMFLASLSAQDRFALTGWLQKNIGFDVFVETSKGHAELKLRDELGRERNIADLGFGYSQMIPILLQLWKKSRDLRGGEPMLLAIEQPELHLHPEYQARLADVFANAVSRTFGRSNLILFVETHSDHIINRIGSLVSSGSLSSSDVQILVVKDEPEFASVAAVEFGSDGSLGDNWPIGFFTPGFS